MSTLSIKIKIADREYPMKVAAEDEGRLRLAGQLLNDRFKELKKQFGIDDKIDLFAMVAFDCMTKNLVQKDEMEELKEEINSKLNEYEAIISSISTNSETK